MKRNIFELAESIALKSYKIKKEAGKAKAQDLKRIAKIKRLRKDVK